MANAAITVDLNARIAKFETELKRATGTLDRFEKKGSAALATFKSFGAGLVGALSVGAITSFAKAGIDAADALNDMSQRTGVAVKTLAEYKLAATLADTSLDDLAKGIQRLTLSQGQAAQGGKAQAEALQRLGITARDPQQAFEQLADAVANSNDPTRIAVDLNALLGRSYVNLLPLLQGGSKALRESAAASADFSDAMVRLAPEAARLNDQLDALKLNAAGAGAAILSKLVPALNDAFERIGLVKNLIVAGGLFNTLVNTAGTGDIGEVMRRVRNEIELTQEAIEGKRARGLDTSAFEQKLRGLNAQLQVLINNRAKALLAPPTSAASGARSRQTGTIDLSGSGKSKAAAKSDPLAGLLGQTDIGRLAAFDKQVALLNARFDGGRKSTELYNQAMTKLVETTFAANFAQFTKDLAEQDETQRLVADHLKATNDELFEQQQAWIDAGKAIEDQYKPGLIQLEERLAYLDELFRRNLISAEALSAGYADAMDNVGVSTKKATDELDTFASQFAENSQNILADFFRDFDKGSDGILKKFGETVKGLIAEASAAQLSKYLFGDLIKGGSGSGFFGGALTKIGDLFGFANGGIMTGSGPLQLASYASGGIASSPRLALFGEGSRPEAFVPLPDGRNIPVRMQGGGGNSFTVIIQGGQNAPDVRRAAAQGMREGLAMMRGAQRYA